MTALTLTDAAAEVGKSKSTLLRAIDAGRLSAQRNEHGEYRVDASELFRVYPPKSEKSVTTPARSEASSDVAPEILTRLLDRLESQDRKLEEMESELFETRQRLDEHREAARALMSPEDFDARLKSEVERLEGERTKLIEQQKEAHAAMLARQKLEQEKALAEQRQQSEEWKAALAERQAEIQAAREASFELEQRNEQERKAREALSQRLAEIESRGLIARLLNRKPKPITAG
jgi:DNA repair exonuclease SbcCD ATPase subunit